jgi:predicted O-linked N-acetylglucosamine transferase (SPINDLY family)
VATADDLFRQALAAHQTGDLDAAERGYRQLLDAAPEHAAALTNLASIVARRGAAPEAEQLYARAVAADPGHADARFNRGNLFRRLGRPHEAAADYEEVLRARPDFPQALVNLGLAAGEAGNWPRAAECFARAAAIAPHEPDVLDLLGDALARCGRPADAVAALRESVARFPNSPRGHYNLGLHLAAEGAIDDAMTAFGQALAFNPDYPEALNALGMALEAVGRVDEAHREYRAAARARPGFADAWANLGASLGDQGQAAEAVAVLRRALALTPSAATGGALLANLLFSADLTPEQLRDEHVVWAEAHADPLAPPEPPARRDRGPAERVRVGYVFGEFAPPPAVAFLDALFTHHDRRQFHVTAYSGPARRGDPFERLHRLADAWQTVTHLPDDALADLVRADEIDVLVDLDGHAPGNRLLAFARKPAPVQVGLFGYPATTGMRAMDFRVTDAVTDPPGGSGALYVERLLRLPDVGRLYAPPADAPAPNAPPAARGRGFTFGCLNHPGKLSEPCVQAWAAVLKAVPKSRLVLLAGQSPAAVEALAERFTRRGVSSDRLELVHRLPVRDYMEAYQPLDLALDPFPYGGGLTTCDALWMGVPVLTVAGRDARGRQGVAVLNALGLPEFVADTPDQLLALAATWADQRASLADLRGALREMMQQSPVTDAVGYVRQLEDAYREALG